jgi:CMP-N,N'-diacetyllegionaminic acid synthase
MTSRYFCAVPARGGSERLPRKNVLPLGGRPMIAYTIDAALRSGCFDEVYVCTDDPEIAQVSRALGASVPELVPAELAGALVASHKPCEWLRARVAPSADVLVCLQPTSPLRSVDDIQEGVRRYDRGDVDFVVSVTPIDPHYFHWACRPSPEADRIELFFGDRYMVERPLLPPVFRPNGSIKIASVAALAATGHFFGQRLGFVETPEERSVHVATRFDADVCEMRLRERSP